MEVGQPANFGQMEIDFSLVLSARVPFLCVALAGCAHDETQLGPVSRPPCVAPEITLADGSCMRPGIAPDGCAQGFLHDGEYACEPTLPSETCPRGLMAVPGEAVCRPVMPCGRGRWGDIPVDDSTVYVDGAYVGMSDGSARRPWSTIGEAVAAATPGALVAIAAGSYAEAILVRDKALRLWGVCPEEVEIVATGLTAGSGCPPAAVCVTSGASGTELRGVALHGPGNGVTISGAEGVMLDRLWVHDAERGIDAENVVGPTSLHVSQTLIEDNEEYGVFVIASEVAIDDTVVRGTKSQATAPALGSGIGIQLNCSEGGCDLTTPAGGTVRRTLVERNQDRGISLDGGALTVEATVVRATLPQASDQEFGRGISVQLSCYPTDVCDPTTRSSAVVRRSIVEQNRDAGLLVMGSDAVVEATVVRGTQPRASNQLYGRGIAVHPLCDATGVCDPRARPQIALSSSLVEDNHDGGVAGAGADVTVEETVVRATSPQASDQKHGRGIDLSVPCANGICDPNAPTFAHVQRTLIEENRDIGLFVSGSDVSVEATVVRQTRARASDGLFGDGVVVFSELAPARATVANVRIEASSRTGVANFGAFVSLGTTRIQCAAIALNGESYREQPFVFEDRGDNNCGCPMADSPCKSQSAGLVPPDPE